MKIAVEGCAHGELDNIYATIRHVEAVENIKIDLLICCGDFQAVRNLSDLSSLACPPKFRSLHSFWKYYGGREEAPTPTLFVGGNHEASNHMQELLYGGWAAPNIYYMGAAGVVRFGGLRIGGISGIYKPHDYHLGHFERPPYTPSDIRSVYHVREFEVRKLLEVRESLDVMVSHDWPRGVTSHGDQRELLRKKPFFREEVENNILGSGPNMVLLRSLHPSYWFSGHLHVKFAAVVRHSEERERTTKFLALDKCLPGKPFLQVVDFPDTKGALEFSYDEEWMGITRAYHSLLPLSRASPQYPRGTIEIEKEKKWVSEKLKKVGSVIPNNFCATVPPHNPEREVVGKEGFPRNPQTEAFLKLLELPSPFHVTSQGGGGERERSGWPATMEGRIQGEGEEREGEGREGEGEGEDSIPDDIDEIENEKKTKLKSVTDPNEIALDDDFEEIEEG